PYFFRALKGHNNRPIVVPLQGTEERQKRWSPFPVPRALPWAKLFSPFGAKNVHHLACPRTSAWEVHPLTLGASPTLRERGEKRLSRHSPSNPSSTRFGNSSGASTGAPFTIWYHKSVPGLRSTAAAWK